MKPNPNELTKRLYQVQKPFGMVALSRLVIFRYPIRHSESEVPMPDEAPQDLEPSQPSRRADTA